MISLLDGWPELITEAMSWGEAAGAGAVRTLVSVEDEEKQAFFEGLGFAGTGPSEPFDLDGREVASVLLERRSG